MRCVSAASCVLEVELTSLVNRLKEVATLFGLLVSQTALALAKITKRVAGRMVRMVSSKSKVKSNCLNGPL